MPSDKDKRGRSVVTVGTRSTLPSIFVENEVVSGGFSNLRFRNRVQEEVLPKKLPDSPDHDDSMGSQWNTLRSTPSYGTPGTSSFSEDQDSPDSGFFRNNHISKDDVPLKKNYYTDIIKDLDGSYIAPDRSYIAYERSFITPDRSYIAPEMSDIKSSKVFDAHLKSPITTDEQPKIKATLDELQRKWRHHQRRAALLGSQNTFKEIWESLSDLDSVKEVLPLVVTTIIIASCFVAVCMLSAGLIRNPEVSKIPDNVNGKYRSIEFGRSKLNERLEKAQRLPPTNLKDENGELLGGKKASIQFAHNLRQKWDGVETPPQVVEPAEVTAEGSEIDEAEAASLETDEILEELSLKVASKVADMVDKLSKEKMDNPEDESERQKLLKKLSQFGHFSTTKIRAEAVDFDAVEVEADTQLDDPEPAKDTAATPATVEAPKVVPVPVLKKPKVVVKRTPNVDPFKAYIKINDKNTRTKLKKDSKEDVKGKVKAEDDPFRGKRTIAKEPKKTEDDPFRGKQKDSQPDPKNEARTETLKKVVKDKVKPTKD